MEGVCPDKIQNGKINGGEPKFKFHKVLEGHPLFDLEKKAKIISDLSKRISEVENAYAPFEVISDFLYDICRNEPEAYQGLQRCYSLTIKYEQLKERSEHELDLQEKAEDILTKLNKLYSSDENIQFLRFLSDGVAMLKNKYDEIKGVGGNKKLIEDSLEKALFPEGENKLERSSIKVIEVSAFGVDVIMEKDYFEILVEKFLDKEKNNKDEIEKRKRNTQALHKPNSFFNIYKEGEEDIEDSRRHERIHNILEGFFSPLAAYPFSLIKDKFSLFDKQGGVEKTKQDILSFSPSECVNLLLPEMLADIESVEKGLSSSINEEQMEGFSTARNQISWIKDFLSERIKEESDEEIKKFCEEFSKKIDKKFDKAASVMRRVLFIENELGKEFIFMVHALLVMMKPINFYHIETYLKSQCGKERYEGYASIYYILFEETIYKKGLRSLLTIKEEISENLKERLREKILQNKNEFESSFALNEDYKEGPESFLSTVKEFYLFLGIE